MAVPKSQHFDRFFSVLHKIQDAIGSLENRELLDFRKGCLEEPLSASSLMWIAEGPNGLLG